MVWPMEATFNEYTLPISRDPSYYGSTCTVDDADRIADSIGRLAQEQFPGLQVEIYPEIGPAGVRGPDPDVCEQITDWVATNWTNAL
jgi:hypothetical protein